MRRALTVLITVAMLFSFVACGSHTSSSQAAAPAASQSAPAAKAEPAKAQPRVLRVGMECAYAPNNWLEKAPSSTNVAVDNQPGGYAEGYDVQMAKLIASYMDNTEVTVVMLSWDGLIEALNQGQIDMIIAGMADTKARREAINFSEPYHTTEYAIMLPNNSKWANAKTIHDFAGASILGQKDTQLDTVIDQMEGVDHLTPVSSVPNMLSRLQSGTCDAIVINVENSASYLASNPNFKIIRFAKGDGFDLGFAGACVGLRKSDTALLSEVNASLAKIDQATRDKLWDAAVESQPK